MYATPKASSLLQMLRRLLRRRASKDPQEVLGLLPDQVASVLQLAQLPAWGHYQRALEALMEIQARPLLSGQLAHDQYLFAAGALEALRKVRELPETLTITRKEPDDRTPIDALRPELFVNTPYYATARRASGH